MKHLILFLLVFIPVLAFAQYPQSGNRSRLGWNTTGDGLIFRGAATPNYRPVNMNNAWLHLDTINYRLLTYIDNQWNVLIDSVGDKQILKSISNDTAVIVSLIDSGGQFTLLEGFGINLIRTGADTSSTIQIIADTSLIASLTALQDTASAIRSSIFNLQFFRETITLDSNLLIVKENGGVLPAEEKRVSVFQNGQYISPQFYTISNDTISLNYYTESWDNFDVMFSTGQGSFTVNREEFTNVTTTITVSTVLPVSDARVQVYQNGQLISPSFYSMSSNTINLSFTADISDNFTVIYI